MNPADIYAMRRAQLARLHPLKAEHRSQAQSLQDQRRGIKESCAMRHEEQQIMAGNPLDLFPTPPDLARRMVAEAAPHGAILEPSAGTGRILDALKAAGFTASFCELNYSAAELLRRRGYDGISGDFMEYGTQADTIIMNPPFSHGQDVEHVLHAFDILNPGGRLVAIMGEGAFFRADKQAAVFRAWLDENAGTSEALPPDTFRSSGTGVNTRLVIIDK